MKIFLTLSLRAIFIYCLLIPFAGNGQSLLISNDMRTSEDNSVELRRRLYISPELPFFCDSTGKCYRYTASPIPKNLDKVSQVDTLVMRTLKQQLLDRYRNQIQELNQQKNDFSLQADTIQGKQAILYYRINNMPIILDTSYTASDKNQIFDTLALLAGDLHVFKMRLDHNHGEIFDFNDYVLDVTLDSAAMVGRIKSINEKAKDNIQQYFGIQKQVDSVFRVQKASLPHLRSELKLLRKALSDNLIARWNKGIVEKYINRQKNKPTEETTFGALPSVNSVIGTRQLVPNIDIHGSAKFENGTSQFAELRFFTGSINTNDFSVIKTLFFSETSTWGLSGRFTWGFAPSRKNATNKVLGLNLEAHYLVKKIKRDTLATSPTFSPGLFQFKGGVELLLIKNILSGYVNANAISFMDNLVGFNDEFVMNKSVYGFADFGVKMLLDVGSTSAKSGDFKILVDFGAIVNGGDVKHFVASPDLIIPTLRLGIRKDLGF